MKIKYQYTYFISPFTIDEKQYDKYILKLLKNKKLKLKIYNKKKNTELSKYFSKEVKNIMFKTMELSETQQKELENIAEEDYEKLLKLPAISFEYLIENETQAKMGQEDGIFFKIDKIELMCFKNGICFIIIKTYLEENADIKNVLNFNYKFKKINLPQEELEVNDQINIQTNEFKDKIEIAKLFQSLTGSQKQEEIYTFSYLCVDGEDWHEQKDFEILKNEFSKLVNVVPANEKEDTEIDLMEKSNYVKIGISKNGTALVTNSLETYNCTKLPFEYENQYLYTLIFALYQKAVLKKVNTQIKQHQKFSKIKKELNTFINEEFLKEITQEEIGSKLFKKWKEKLEIENNYLETISKYEMAYKDEKIRKSKRNNIIIWGILAICIITNIINVIILWNISK